MAHLVWVSEENLFKKIKMGRGIPKDGSATQAERAGGGWGGEHRNLERELWLSFMVPASSQ